MTGVRVGSVERGHCVVRSAESVDDHPLLVNRVGGVSAWRAETGCDGGGLVEKTVLRFGPAVVRPSRNMVDLPS